MATQDLVGQQQGHRDALRQLVMDCLANESAQEAPDHHSSTLYEAILRTSVPFCFHSASTVAGNANAAPEGSVQAFDTVKDFGCGGSQPLWQTLPYAAVSCISRSIGDEGVACRGLGYRPRPGSASPNVRRQAAAMPNPPYCASILARKMLLRADC